MSPEILKDVNCDEWLSAVRSEIVRLREQFAIVHIVGMCMGALLALEIAKELSVEHNGQDCLILLAPPIFLDGWALPKLRWLRHVAYRLPLIPRWIRIKESEPYGVKNTRLRRIIERKFLNADPFHYAWVPLTAIRELDRLRRKVRRGLQRLEHKTLIVQALDDELTSIESARHIRDVVNHGRRDTRVRLKVLTDSFHMICIDNENEDVAQHVVSFLQAADRTTRSTRLAGALVA